MHGPHEPSRGHRFNPAKLVLDPYARAIDGSILWDDALYGYTIGHDDADLSRDHRDSAASIPKCVVIDSAFTWGDGRPLRIPWEETVIYELHAKGFTARHPGVPELLPVHQFVADRHLVEGGRTNYWGYNSIGFFAPDARYASGDRRGGRVAEFKTMVKTLHEAGIEVILDVVFNHTGKGNHLGPTLCFRGVDNASYYRLVAGDARHYTAVRVVVPLLRAPDFVAAAEPGPLLGGEERGQEIHPGAHRPAAAPFHPPPPVLVLPRPEA